MNPPANLGHSSTVRNSKMWQYLELLREKMALPDLRPKPLNLCVGPKMLSYTRLWTVSPHSSFL